MTEKLDHTPAGAPTRGPRELLFEIGSPESRCVDGACQASTPPTADFALPASLATNRRVSVTATAQDPDPGDVGALVDAGRAAVHERGVRDRARRREHAVDERRREPEAEVSGAHVCAPRWRPNSA